MELNLCCFPNDVFHASGLLVEPTFSCISRALSLHNIKTVGLSIRKVSSFLQPVKDALGLKTPRIYSIPCKCGKVHIGQTRHSIKTRTGDHHWHTQLYHPDKSVEAEHSINLVNHLQLNDIRILAKNPRHM
jgi:hypothetical protein